MLKRLGDDLLSVTVGRPPDAQALAEQLRNAGNWLEVVAGIDSVVVRFDATVMDVATAEKAIESSLADGIQPLRAADTLLVIPVVYGGDEGPDLAELCHELGISKEEFISLHTGSEYRVDMVGFTPGFAFIGGLDEKLRIPRRKEPRQSVPAGSVGIADGRTGLYSLNSPGGWTLVGRTTYTLFDPESDEPFALHAGMRIRFKAINAEAPAT